MIDIHCHILPGIDDGAQTESDSIAMANAAVDQGIDTIIATPHHMNGKYENSKQDIITHVNVLNDLFQEEDIPLTILPGQEIRMNGEIIDELEDGIIQSLNHSKYLFVEFPSSSVPRYAKQMLFDIQLAGYKPVIVHPERNQVLIEHPSMLYEFVKKGSLTQITAGSLCGKFGKNLQKFSHQLVEANLTHFIASDAHNTTSRGFTLQEGYKELMDQHGVDARYMFMENAQLLVESKTVNRLEPAEVKKKKFLGIF
ncbi:tyrosine protein phosphatase [Virgibacillus phasianinus]|uniref:Tyrosine-protein phosphatase n=1 Tax=Virgibacillus phasianinus TaxID=2017483 RepID=A0A220U297_9BACI|nr:CpsB/CapC family capsule biosynthesis tyrosine phosphatase [Virgibacillus phasianinus]ASK62278.1 tyrosine protein phosphatase [Virgibacillus phasianinus]